MAFNPHAGEPVKANPVSTRTEVMLDNVLAKGGKVAMQALSAALSTLAASIVMSINNEAKQAASIAMNKMALNGLATFPSVSLPDVGAAMKTINSIIGGATTLDTSKVQKAAQATSTTPNPAAMATFTSKMADISATQSQQRMDSLTNSLADVNGVKAAVDRRI